MKRLLPVVAALWAAGMAFTTGPALATTWVVDAPNPALECPDADYASINAAVNAPTTLPGDRILVCPGLYLESVLVPKAEITIVAQHKPEVDCFDPVTPVVDPTRHSIVDGVAHSFSLANDSIEIDGFVVQGALRGILTSTLFSGYDIRENLVWLNFYGIDHNASGAMVSRVRHNCMRQNAGGHASETGDLRNARIEHNETFRNISVGISAASFGIREDVVIDHNRTREELFGFVLSNSRDSALVHNIVDPSPIPNNGIVIAGGNVRLDVSHNEIGPSLGIPPLAGLVFNAGFPGFPTPNTDIVVSHNNVFGRSTGIVLQPNSVDASLFAHNKTNDNTIDGIRLSTGNNANLFEHNEADRNARDGIRVLLGATGNTFSQNRMFDNLEHDAHDDNRPANVWVRNKCETDFPPGTIC